MPEASFLSIVFLFFIWGACVTPLAINLAGRFRLMDFPGGRKCHDVPMPRGAGIVLWSGYLLWVLIFTADIPFFKFVSTGATIVFLVGYLDDMCQLSPILRLVLHVISACLIVFPLKLPGEESFIFVFWITGTTNAYNLVDGLNGLALSMFISASLFSMLLGHLEIWAPGAAMALGVLLWNFPKARTFLGDGGSTLLGFLFSAHFFFCFMPLLKNNNSTVVLLPILLLWGGVPVIDTLFAIIRRALRKGSPFMPDRGHMHHRLLDLGLSSITTVLLLSIVHLSLLTGGLIVTFRYLAL